MSAPVKHPMNPWNHDVAKDEKDLIEWRVPAPGLRLPGAILIEFTCLECGQQAEPARLPRKAGLVLDAWAAK